MDTEKKHTLEEKQLDSHLARILADELITPKMLGEGVGFERTRRITGYLVGSLKRFNNAKRAEEKDRVKHD